MSTLLTLRQATVEDAVVVHAEGEIDLATAPQLAAALTLATADARRLLVADLAKVRFLGSAGMAVLVTASAECAEQGRTLVMVADPTGPARRSLHLTGLDSVLVLADDLPSALSARLPDAPAS